MTAVHNLPNRPYRKFFGRTEAIKQIEETLIEGGTFIASIDGVGGIGKTALAYHFCENVLLPSERFDYVVWISSKKTVFDPFSKEVLIKRIDNDFYGIETLIDTTLRVTGFEEVIDAPFPEKKDFFEEILRSEKVFFVLDNLETIEDEEFFSYITRDFNKISAQNRFFKVLTTSRKRKRIIDFPIEIEGLTTEDALAMLKYLAREFGVKAISNASDFQNIRLLERVGNIPLGIEFIVGQMALGKTLGDIFRELEGYPTLDGVTDEEEKKRRLSSIILFSFKGMYETLDYDHQRVFKTIAVLHRHKNQEEEEISLELLMSLTRLSKYKLDRILEDLIDSKLITVSGAEYGISQMAVNFVRQYYEEFEQFEDEIIGLKDKISQGNHRPQSRVDVFLDTVRAYIEENKYEEAEEHLLKALDVHQEARLYYELAKIQRVLNKFTKASDSFAMATQLDPHNAKIWYDWINMEDARQRHNIALHLAQKALDNTHNNVSIVIQMLNIHKYRRDYEIIRRKVKFFLKRYREEGEGESARKLLRYWKSVEYHVARSGGPIEFYVKASELLYQEEEDLEARLQILLEMYKVIKREDKQKAEEVRRRIRNLRNRIKGNIGARVKLLNRLFNQHDYSSAKKEARRILRWFDREEKQDFPYFKNALRVLLQVLAREEDYNSILRVFSEYEEIGSRDDNCQQIYEKAKRQLFEQQRNALIGEISANIQRSEVNLRTVIMWALDSQEDNLLSLVKGKGKEEWIAQWRMTRDKALKKDGWLIHYTDLSHLRSLLKWTRALILKRIEGPKHQDDCRKLLKQVVAYLEEFVSQERNEAFHSRLLLFNEEELQAVLVDTRRLLDSTEQLKEFLGISFTLGYPGSIDSA